MPPWTAASDHLRLAVRLTPKASADRIDGIKELSDGTSVLAARVRATPESGRANRAVETLVAAMFGVPRSDVTVIGGPKNRLKQLRIDGDPGALLDLAERLWPTDTMDGAPGKAT